MGKPYKNKDTTHKKSSPKSHQKDNDEKTKASAREGLGVKSANAWEDVKFNSRDRKEKFLRLMGAEKQRKHGGKILVGEKAHQHAKAGVGVEKIGESLERQFHEGLDHKTSWNRHAGLGCSQSSSSTILQNKSIRLDNDETLEQPQRTPKGKYTMNFVKSSDWLSACFNFM